MIDCNILRDLIDQAISSEWKDIPVPPDVMTEVLDCLEQLSDMHETTLVWAREWRNERDALAAHVEHFPLGAVVNGQELLRRLADHYQFECEGGPVEGCVEYQELERCFVALLEYAQAATTTTSLARHDADLLDKWAERFSALANAEGDSGYRDAADAHAHVSSELEEAANELRRRAEGGGVMITSMQGITADRARALTERSKAHLTYIRQLEKEVEESIHAGKYQASAPVRVKYADEVSNYWWARGFVVSRADNVPGYVTVTVDWSHQAKG